MERIIFSVSLLIGLFAVASLSQTLAPGCPCGPCTCMDVRSELPRPTVTLASGLEVVCDTQTDDGGWIVFQRRASAQVDFYRGWEDYKFGFGDLHGNFWWGLEKLHRLTTDRQYMLRVDLVVNGTDFFAEYDNFMILGEPENYKIRVSDYYGTAGDALGRHNGKPFTTFDNDHDDSSGNCAVIYHGAWWYDACHSANLNGHFGNNTYGMGLDWFSTHGDYFHSATFTEMKIKPVNFN